MAMVKKSITITAQQEAWIQSQLASGNYGTDSELIREALRENNPMLLKLSISEENLLPPEKAVLSIKTAMKY